MKLYRNRECMDCKHIMLEVEVKPIHKDLTSISGEASVECINCGSRNILSHKAFVFYEDVIDFTCGCVRREVIGK